MPVAMETNANATANDANSSGAPLHGLLVAELGQVSGVAGGRGLRTRHEVLLQGGIDHVVEP